jgi:DNA transposition AAA+ family ATPase
MMIKKLLNELNDGGMNDYVIAAEIKVSQPTIWRLRTGKNASTNYDVGKRIERLAKTKNISIDDD